MSALLSLTEEHETISGLLGALQTYATRMRSGATVDPADLARFSQVLHEIVDYRHHEKEEGILMPLLARNGFEWSTGLLAELRHEHGHLRHLIDVLAQAASKDSASSREQRRQVVEVALDFVEYKRRHIAKEEDVLFPAILERLDARALEQLTAELERFDRATGVASRGPLEQIANELVTRYSEDSGMVDVTGLRWTVAADPREQGEAKGSQVAEFARRITSFGRSR